MQDVIIIGGSYAGMAAALQLLRARRSVLVIDAGQRRNRFSGHSHGFLGQDGLDPRVIYETARGQLQKYPTLTWLEDTVQSASGRRDAFVVQMTDGTSHEGRRLLFATGLADQLPDIPGLQERWGTSVFHCPYCHAYELDQQPIGIIGTSETSVDQAQLLSEWGETTLFANESVTLNPEILADLHRRGVKVETQPISHIDGIAEVVLTNGERQSFAGLFTATRCAPASPIAERMGCEMSLTPVGVLIETADTSETNIPGVFACGDVARPAHSVSLAVGDGAWAGTQVHRSLVWPDA